MLVSKAEKLLAAACALIADGREEFTAEDLVVRAHDLFPDDFSLKGYREHPDSNLVLTQLMGVKAPLIVRGWLEKTGSKQYRVTSKALYDFANRVALGDSRHTEAVVSVERRQDEAIGRLMTSAAFDLFREGRANEITFHQFCRFVGLSARDKWQRVSGRLSTVRHLAEEARRLGESGQALRTTVERTYTFSSEDLRALPTALDCMLTKFAREMVEWRKNAG